MEENKKINKRNVIWIVVLIVIAVIALCGTLGIVQKEKMEQYNDLSDQIVSEGEHFRLTDDIVISADYKGQNPKVKITYEAVDENINGEPYVSIIMNDKKVRKSQMNITNKDGVLTYVIKDVDAGDGVDIHAIVRDGDQYIGFNTKETDPTDTTRGEALIKEYKELITMAKDTINQYKEQTGDKWNDVNISTYQEYVDCDPDDIYTWPVNLLEKLWAVQTVYDDYNLDDYFSMEDEPRTILYENINDYQVYGVQKVA